MTKRIELRVSALVKLKVVVFVNKEGGTDGSYIGQSERGMDRRFKITVHKTYDF